MKLTATTLNWPLAVPRTGSRGRSGIGVLGLLTAALIASSCAQQKPTAPVELIPAKLLEPQHLAVPQKDVLDQQPEDVKAAIQNYARGQPAPVLHEGITTIFPYDANSQPVIECRPLRVTDISLESGEEVESVAAGDTERWVVTSAEGRVLIKPKAPGIATNLIILTDHHSYILGLKASRNYMPRVAFYYPGEVLAAEQERKPALDMAAEQTMAPPELAKLNFGYSITGPDVPWKPVQIFDDGARVYVEMPEHLMASDAPSLMVASNGKDALVNYQVKDRYYLVDRLFNQAVLVSGTGSDRKEVIIKRDSALRS
jgi:type IV secretion system protein TrbG